MCHKILIAPAEVLISKKTSGSRKRRGMNGFQNQMF
jgi:hypothetical protein